MDGVLTDTAVLHAAAWKQALDPLLRRLDPRQPPFDAQAEYRRYIDGKSRQQAIGDFLAARGLEVALRGPAGAGSVAAVTAHKDGLFGDLLRRQGVRPLPGAAECLERARRCRQRRAVVSASHHCAEVMQAAGLAEGVEVRVDGQVADALALPGKPDPALFLEAARRLAVAPAQAVVLEDAEAGVRAARAGGFARVIGIGGNVDGLRAAGADCVLPDLRALL